MVHHWIPAADTYNRHCGPLCLRSAGELEIRSVKLLSTNGYLPYFS